MLKEYRFHTPDLFEKVKFDFKKDLELRAWIIKGMVFGYPENTEPDALHHDFHRRQTANYAKAIAEENDDWNDSASAYQSGLECDEGYRAFEAGLIPHEMHAYASALMSAFSPGKLIRRPGEGRFTFIINTDIPEAILLHSLDQLPPDSSRLTKTLQSADRLAGLPPYGIFAFAKYKGMKSDFLNGKFKRIDWGFLPKERDERDPRFVDYAEDSEGKVIASDYERGLRTSCKEVVFPWLEENGLMEEAIEHAKTLLDRIYGVPGKIDPIFPKAIEVFKVKLFVAKDTLRQMENYHREYESRRW